MKTILAIAVFAVLLFAVSGQEHMCICGQIFDPVCGSDGVWYDNKCLMACKYVHANEDQGACGANRMRRSEGEEHMCICGQIFDPVCGSDGVWYDNKCLMACKYILANEDQGACGANRMRRSEGEEHMCICGQIFDPVCGSDGLWYDNKCLMACKYIHANEDQGACGANRMRRSAGEEHMCICGQIFDPVCGSDGVWYDNKCLMACKYIHANEDQGACGANRMRRSEVSGEEHMCICGQIFAPVCGSDGVWYDNKCLMACKNIHANEDQGACGESSVLRSG
ncbi:serine protease inhibitor dipetalogastin-like isoform X6 [Dreissena polymorpha]|uniref:serine protease inhibitor dipetalogastin-like isoform X6 n=1 Tax=Dreissena polymorpha TaxID=45954 RepID=UPI0022646880|nr:serine protease inhibitor dipetalogastin-like isoform X6 [Dreissena polymorpha]